MAIIIPKKGEKAEWIRTFEVDGPVQTQASNLGIARKQ